MCIDANTETDLECKENCIPAEKCSILAHCPRCNSYLKHVIGYMHKKSENYIEVLGYLKYVIDYMQKKNEKYVDVTDYLKYVTD